VLLSRYQQGDNQREKSEGKRPHDRPRRNWEDIIKTDLKATEREDTDWVNLSYVRDQWRIL
jgi:hypothetical protein